MPQQPLLFDLPPLTPPSWPDGFRFEPELISPAEEQALIGWVAELPFQPFEFHGFVGNRRVVSFGWRYDFARRVLEPAEPIPEFLLPLRRQVAAFTGHDPQTFQQALVLEYAPGAGIGWHRDRPHFEDVAGVSLGAPCLLRLRLRTPDGWRRAKLTLTPGSAYLLSGTVRNDWEHSIPPLEARRYSVTFRTFRSPDQRSKPTGMDGSRDCNSRLVAAPIAQ